jgi:hypothetical protein
MRLSSRWDTQIVNDRCELRELTEQGRVVSESGLSVGKQVVSVWYIACSISPTGDRRADDRIYVGHSTLTPQDLVVQTSHFHFGDVIYPTLTTLSYPTLSVPSCSNGVLPGGQPQSRESG